MDHSLPVTCLLNLPRSGTSTITPAHQGIQGAVVKQKPQSRSSKDYSHMLSTQDKTPILPCWHLGAHPSMPTSIHQLRCYTTGPPAPYYHKGSITRTPMLQMTMIDSTNVPPRGQSTMTVTASQGKQYLSSISRTLWLLAKPPMAPTLYRL